MESLRRRLRRIDGRGYKAYKEVRGAYQFLGYTLHIDHVQGDPFAAPSRVRVLVADDVAGFSPQLYSSRCRRVGLEDYLTRSFARAVAHIAKGRRGTGKSGSLSIQRCGQEILERSSVVVSRGEVEARFTVGLPARGRTVLGRQAEEIFLEEIPAIVKRSLCARNLDKEEMKGHVETAEDQDAIRNALASRGYVCFVGDGSVLPRKSGIDDRPMDASRAVPFISPDGLRTSFKTPNRGEVYGMAIAAGVTLVVGGGYHGKSTLLRAIERGVYDHVPGDGRELVVTVKGAVKVRAEDGRRVEKVDISPFLENLPSGVDTKEFSTEDASGSTSQAANIVEAVEVGADLLLMDEDTCATNFMIRDRRMQELISKEKEPITPFLDRVRDLSRQWSVSSILVLGGSGDYLDVADVVIALDTYHPYDVTGTARRVALKHKTRREVETRSGLRAVTERAPLAESFHPGRGRRDVKIDARTRNEISFGRTSIDLSCVEQLVDIAQTRAIGDAVHRISRRCAAGSCSIDKLVRGVEEEVEKDGLDVLSPFEGQVHGGYALPRRFEIAAAINRMRTLSVIQLR